MKEQLVSSEVAKLAKEKGFNWPTIHYMSSFGDRVFEKADHTGKMAVYSIEGRLVSFNTEHPTNGLYDVPTQSHLQKWIRDNHGIHINVTKVYECSKSPAIFDGWNIYIAGKDFETNYEVNSILLSKYFVSYENALEEGLFEALKLIN